MFDEWTLLSNTYDTTYRSERDEKEAQHLQKEGKHRGVQFIFFVKFSQQLKILFNGTK